MLFSASTSCGKVGWYSCWQMYFVGLFKQFGSVHAQTLCLEMRMQRIRPDKVQICPQPKDYAPRSC